MGTGAAIGTEAVTGAGASTAPRPMGRYIRRFALWLGLTLPVGVLAGGIFTLWESDTADFFRAAEIAGGLLIGGVLAVFGAAVATATTLAGRGALRRSGGSELLTGAIVAYGVVIIGLLLARTVDGSPVR